MRIPQDEDLGKLPHDAAFIDAGFCLPNIRTISPEQTSLNCVFSAWNLERVLEACSTAAQVRSDHGIGQYLCSDPVIGSIIRSLVVPS